MYAQDIVKGMEMRHCPITEAIVDASDALASAPTDDDQRITFRGFFY
jgi:hypothetical protein